LTKLKEVLIHGQQRMSLKEKDIEARLAGSTKVYQKYCR
jgi:hypothetical protein